MRRMLYLGSTIGLLLLSVGLAEAQEVSVPFVGCPSVGMMGDWPAPSSMRNIPVVPAKHAHQLAYYSSAALGVLAPRGWFCFGIYGSSGWDLVVTPEPLPNDTSAEVGKHGIKVSRLQGGTSGRFFVAHIASGYFPIAKSFVQKVIAEGIEPKENFLTAPYPKDKLIRQSKTVVEYVTPGNTMGLGLVSGLPKTADPVQGVAIILPDQDMDLVIAHIRLPADLRSLAGTIITGVARNRAAAGEEAAETTP